VQQGIEYQQSSIAPATVMDLDGALMKMQVKVRIDNARGKPLCATIACLSHAPNS
jgi:hypothetical protein